ncbi:MAG: hypothetical protein AB3X44_15135 [Leptothrix sp. (in: b-proteobacteria)]
MITKISAMAISLLLLSVHCSSIAASNDACGTRVTQQALLPFKQKINQSLSNYSKQELSPKTPAQDLQETNRWFIEIIYTIESIDLGEKMILVKDAVTNEQDRQLVASLISSHYQHINFRAAEIINGLNNASTHLKSRELISESQRASSSLQDLREKLISISCSY